MSVRDAESRTVDGAGERMVGGFPARPGAVCRELARVVDERREASWAEESHEPGRVRRSESARLWNDEAAQVSCLGPTRSRCLEDSTKRGCEARRRRAPASLSAARQGRARPGGRSSAELCIANG
jgi:hypothetical protein